MQRYKFWNINYHTFLRVFKIYTIENFLVSKHTSTFNDLENFRFLNVPEPHANQNRKKPNDVDQEVKKYLKESLSMEYEFYNWIRARLFQQLKIITGQHSSH